MAPHSSTLAWKTPWMEESGRLQFMGLLDFTFSFHFPALEEEMATHSSVLAWRIPGTGEPGGLPSMGSHRAGHDWSDLAAAAVLDLCTSQAWAERSQLLVRSRGTARPSAGGSDVLHRADGVKEHFESWRKNTDLLSSFQIQFYWKPSPSDVCTLKYLTFNFVFCWKKIFLATPCGTWDLSSLTRNQTLTPCSGNTES